MDLVEARGRVALLLERERADTWRVQGYRKASAALDAVGPARSASRIEHGTLTDLPDVGPRTGRWRLRP
ncbi:hypothetical protein [Longivirga aurantiaca]|uniref:DNA polymerase beta-like N-terminal domain-containing protein n=1 Tax=Longivirga aurantiaca TaxID=1837743 RepID=A0ABW1SZK4_9ACTN